MAPSSESDASARWDSGDTGEVRAEALDVLSDVVLWRLAEKRWIGIEQALAAMAVALESDDTEALAAATVDLELAGPVRITPIGAAVGPTPTVRDLLNKLVHALGGVTVEPRAQEPGEAGAGNAGTYSG